MSAACSSIHHVAPRRCGRRSGPPSRTAHSAADPMAVDHHLHWCTSPPEDLSLSGQSEGSFVPPLGLDQSPQTYRQRMVNSKISMAVVEVVVEVEDLELVDLEALAKLEVDDLHQTDLLDHVAEQVVELEQVVALVQVVKAVALHEVLVLLQVVLVVVVQLRTTPHHELQIQHLELCQYSRCTATSSP